MTGTLTPRRIRHALIILGALTLGAPAAALAQCDLDATFGGNASQTFPTGQPANLTVRFTNLASTGDCAANQVRLRLTGGNFVAAAMAFQALPALTPKGAVLLTFEVQSPLPATLVYEVEYATPHHDADDGNHRPTRTVTFTSPAVTLALPDLSITAVRPAADLRVGDCNTVSVTVRNAGAALSTTTQLTLMLFGPLPDDTTVDRKALTIGAFAAGEVRTVAVPALRVPKSGSWRLEAVADATLSVSESNETNNVAVLKVDAVERRCAP